MAIRDKVSKAEVLEHGSVTKALEIRHHISPPRKIVIIASTEGPDGEHTVLYDVEKESSGKAAQKAQRPGPNVAIIKIPQGVHPKVLGPITDALAKAINGHVFIFPIDIEVLLGTTARQDLENLHNEIHNVLDQEQNQQT